MPRSGVTETPRQEKENKPTPRKSSRLQAPLQNGFRVQTEVENTSNYDEMYKLLFISIISLFY